MMKYKNLFLLLFLIPIKIEAGKLIEMNLSDYGSIEGRNLENTIRKAIDDLDDKRLILPLSKLDINDLIIENKKNFEIVGDTTFAITCRNFLIKDCANFELSGLFVKGTKEKFTTFYIKGNCSNFRIHDCLFDSEQNADGHNTFYGIHIIADYQGKQTNFSNSPRNFKIDHNIVKHTRYDGILAHAYCSDFIIEYNTVLGAECIGIEIEGRLGGNNNTTVHPCQNAQIKNNIIRNSGNWGILIMWGDKIRVFRNKSFQAGGAFLSIGCSNITIKNNFFEGLCCGFEISQEYYDVAKGINNNVKIKGNIIKARARGKNRGVLDIRHAKNVNAKNNKVKSLYRDNTAYVSLASCQQVTIRKNHFSFTDKPLQDLIYKTNVPSPETNEIVSALDLDNLDIQEIIIRE